MVLPLIEALRRDGVVLLPNVHPLGYWRSHAEIPDYVDWIRETYLGLAVEEKISLGLLSPRGQDVVTGFPNGRRIMHLTAQSVIQDGAADERNTIAYCSLRDIAEDILRILTGRLATTNEPPQGVSTINEYIESARQHSAATPVRPFEKGSQMSIFDYADCRPPATSSDDAAASQEVVSREGILCDEHCDRGLLTVVTNDVAGLQVYLNDQWVTVPRTDGIVVFLGLAGAKLLENGLGGFPAVRHRVVHPACAGAPEMPLKQRHAAERLEIIATQMNFAALPAFTRHQFAAQRTAGLGVRFPQESNELEVGIAFQHMKDVRAIQPSLNAWANSAEERALAKKLGEPASQSFARGEWKLLQKWLQRELRGRCGMRTSISFKLRPPQQVEVGGAAEESLVRMMATFEAQLSSVNRPPPRHLAPIGEGSGLFQIADIQSCSRGFSAVAPWPQEPSLLDAVHAGMLYFFDLESFLRMGLVCKQWRTLAENTFNEHPRSKLLMSKENIPWQRHQSLASQDAEMYWFRFAGMWVSRLRHWASTTTSLCMGKWSQSVGRMIVLVDRSAQVERVSLAQSWSDVCCKVAQAQLGRNPNVDRASARWRLDINGSMISIPTRALVEAEIPITECNSIMDTANRLINNHGTDVFLGEVLEEFCGNNEVQEILHYLDPMKMKAD